MNRSDDSYSRFLLEHAGVRGVLVRLSDVWREVASRADYPAPLRDLLGQSLAASALLSANVKFQGSLSLQLKSAGPVTLLFAQCEQDQLRGLAQWQGEIPPELALDQLAEPIFVVTLEHADGRRQQGLIPVEKGGFGELIEHYFERSEQLPTRILTAVSADCSAALLLQRVATAGGHNADPDAWNRVLHLAATLSQDELLHLPAETVLHRLFHEEGVRLLETQALRFGCRCSRERVGAVLLSLGRAEAEGAVQADGRVEVTCEFCNTHYHFDQVDLEQLFREGGTAEVPPTAH
jgi:molecular chaperone Hsp33